MPRGAAHAVVRRGVDAGETVGDLAEVVVMALGLELVVARHGLDQVFHRQTELFSQLFDGVGLDDVAGLDQALNGLPRALERPVGRGAVVKQLQAAAAEHLEAVHVLREGGIPDVAVGVVLLELHGVGQVLVQAGLVAEALAVQVDLHERLLAEPEVLARGVVAGDGVGHDGGAVEEHGQGVILHHAARPQRGLDAGAVVGRALAGSELEGQRLTGLEHLAVAGVAAGGDDDALGGVDEDVLALGVLADGAGDAVIVLDELDEGGLGHGGAAEAVGVVLQNVGDAEGLLAVGGRGVTGRPGLVAAARGAHAGFQPHGVAVLFQDVGVPVDGLVGVVRPDVPQAGVDAGGGVLDDVLHALVLVDEVLAVLFDGLELLLGADGAKVALRGGELRAALDHDGLRAVFKGGGVGRPAGGTGTDDEHFGVVLGDALGERDLRLNAQPRRNAGGQLRGGFLGHGGLLLGDQVDGGKASGAGGNALQKASAGNRHSVSLLCLFCVQWVTAQADEIVSAGVATGQGPETGDTGIFVARCGPKRYNDE